MLYFLEYPKPEADVVPRGKEKTSNKRPDIGRNAEEMIEPRDDAKVDKVIQSHKQNEPYHFLAGFTLTRLIIKHPLFVHEEEQYMRKDASDCNRRYFWPAQQFIKYKQADIGSPKEDIACQLQFYELNDVLEQFFSLFFGHNLYFL